jgi:predicted  nucleic acid-binding Zn-ribbon protein
LSYRYSSVRHSHITEEIKNAISTKQAEVKSAITTTDKQLVVVENKLDELNLSSDDEEGAGSREGQTEALRQLEEELKAVKASQKLLNELLSKLQEEAVAKAAVNQSHSTTVKFGDQNSGFQAATINGGVSGINFGGK